MPVDHSQNMSLIVLNMQHTLRPGVEDAGLVERREQVGEKKKQTKKNFYNLWWKSSNRVKRHPDLQYGGTQTHSIHKTFFTACSLLGRFSQYNLTVLSF